MLKFYGVTEGPQCDQVSFVAICVFDLDTSGLKIETLADCDAAGKFAEVITNTESVYGGN